MYRFAEFFAGAGMVRAALSSNWQVAMANDIDPKKCRSYSENWGSDELITGDIASIDPKVLQQPIDLYWASSPCQDFSLAGLGRGLDGARSGVFRHWVELIRESAARGFAPKILAFENVRGLLTRNAGADFIRILESFHALGYKFGALEIDARLFLPQSRPRLFVIAVRNDVCLSPDVISREPTEMFHSVQLTDLIKHLPPLLRHDWVWWRLPVPKERALHLHDLISHSGTWFDQTQVDHLLAMMDEPSSSRISSRKQDGGNHVGTIYKRGRPDETGKVRQRAEVRFDGLAGCLRTPAGGSSRQTVVIVSNGQVRMRLLTPREAMRLMGVPDSYKLPLSFNDAYRLAGDGVAVPVVSFLDQHLLQSLVTSPTKSLSK
jgi:DNA (cytosine-5)-methyltransferase 1